jgi:general secretion pathway protein M
MLESLKQNASVLSMQKQYEAMPARDRLALKLLGVAVLMCVVYFLIWVPAQNYMQNAQRDYEQNQQLLATIKTNKIFLSSLVRNSGASGTQKIMDSQQLVSSVTNMAKRNGVTLKRFEPSGDTQLKVWVDNVSFDKMIAWLAALQASLNVSVEQISIEKDDVAGQVSARLTLSS